MLRPVERAPLEDARYSEELPFRVLVRWLERDSEYLCRYVACGFRMALKRLVRR